MPKGRTLYLINVKPDEVEDYQRLHRKTVCLTGDLEECSSQIKSDSHVFIEDVIKLKNAQEQTLRHWLNYRAHHQRLKIFVVTHTVYRTSLSSMLPLFNYILFTTTFASRTLLGQTLTYFNMTKEEKAKWLKVLKSCPETVGNYAILDCNDTSLSHLGTNGHSKVLIDQGVGNNNNNNNNNNNSGSLAPSASSSSAVAGSDNGTHDSEVALEKMEKKFFNFFTGHACQANAGSIFSLIVRSVPSNAISLRDLSLQFRRRSDKKPVKVSLVDYIDVLLTPNPVAGSREEFKVAHNYITSVCKLPQLLILNPQFRV